jgi:hypothetical protein
MSGIYPKELVKEWLDDGEEIIIEDPITGGKKGVKAVRFDLIPPQVLWLLARLYGHGCKKYAERNWEKGYKWSQSYASLRRHLDKFWMRKNIDDDSGKGSMLPHLVAVIWHAVALLYFSLSGIGTDDRPAELINDKPAPTSVPR